MNKIFIVINEDYIFEGAYDTLKNAYDFVKSYFDSDNFTTWEIQERELKNGCYCTTKIYDYASEEITRIERNKKVIEDFERDF